MGLYIAEGPTDEISRKPGGHSQKETGLSASASGRCHRSDDAAYQPP
jgi:hypothetical protein